MSKSAVYEATTDANGDYVFDQLPLGTYQLLLELPDKLASQREEDPEIKVTKDNCAEENFDVYTKGEVEGRVLLPDGKPAFGVVHLVSASADPRELEELGKSAGVSEQLENGGFRFRNLSPGRYKLFYLEREYYHKSGPSTFFPGVPSFLEAHEIILGDGERIHNLVFRLPNTAPAPKLESELN